MKDLLKTLEYINTLAQETLLSNKRYFEKFLPVNEDIKTECCHKDLIRISNRHCNNCPCHPINEMLYPEKFLLLANKLLEENNFMEFTILLANNDLPFPNKKEIEHLFLEK